MGEQKLEHNKYAPTMSLTEIKCKNAKPSEKARKLSDAAGLYLEVAPNGSKYWRLKYRVAGKEKRLALGVYPEVSLKEARDKQNEARKILQSGIDPSQVRKLDKLKKHLSAENNFESLAREWLSLC
ncbi:MAG: Arm DNA-binding domain-containing protein [Pseudomonadota bacterium]